MALSKVVRFGLAILMGSTCCFAQKASELTVGAIAPELRVHSWVKGHEASPKRKPYLVGEFWATWCGPCKKAIPSLTRIARTFKKSVDIIGVSVYEASGGQDFSIVPAKVTEFVKMMGKQMDYAVAIDGPDKFMSQNWLEAAGRKTIPATFLIDRNGKILWIGSDTFELEYALRLLNGGTNEDELASKVEAYQKEVAEDKKQSQALMSTLTRDIPAEKRLSIFEEACRLDRDLLVKEGPLKISLLIEIRRFAEASKFAKGEFFEVNKNDPDLLLNVAYCFIQADKPSKEQIDLAHEFCLKSMALRKDPDAYCLDCLARIFYAKKNVKKALEYQTKAIALAQKDKSINEGNMSAMTEALKKYQHDAGIKQ